MNAKNITTFLGWSSVISLSLLAISYLVSIVAQDWVSSYYQNIHQISVSDFQLLLLYMYGIWKILTFVLFVIPYFALKMTLRKDVNKTHHSL